MIVKLAALEMHHQHPASVTLACHAKMVRLTLLNICFEASRYLHL